MIDLSLKWEALIRVILSFQRLTNLLAMNQIVSNGKINELSENIAAVNLRYDVC